MPLRERHRPGTQPGPQQRPGRAIAAVLVAAFAVFAAVAAFRVAPPQHTPVKLVARVPITLAPPPAPLPPYEIQARRGPSPAAAPARSPRDVVESALQSEDPQLRGQAWRLLRHCALVLSTAARPLVAPPPWLPSDRVRQADRAWEAVAGRCDSLRGLGNPEALLRQLDPVPPFHAREPHPLQAEGRWLADTFRREGATALGWAGDALADYLEQRLGQPDGDAFEPLEPEAIQIARCRFGEDCGAESDAALEACLTLGACDGDLERRLLSSLRSRPERERVLRQAEALAAALRQGDLSRYALGR
jgi:hypothetical protein